MHLCKVPGSEHRRQAGSPYWRAIRSLVDENAYKNVARDLVGCHVMSLTSHVNGLGFEYRWRKLFFLFTSA